MGSTTTAYKWSLVSSLVALICAIIAIASNEWTVIKNDTEDKTIGLWMLSDDGVDYVWTEQWGYQEDFFYQSFMQACRGLIMCGVMIAGLGCIYNMFVLVKKKVNMLSGTIIFGYYMLASFLLLITACVYSAMIPQRVCVDGSSVCDDVDVVSYKYRGNYGYSLWFCWIGGGLFMLPAAMALEGGRQHAAEKRGNDLIATIKNRGDM